MNIMYCKYLVYIKKFQVIKEQKEAFAQKKLNGNKQNHIDVTDGESEFFVFMNMYFNL